MDVRDVNLHLNLISDKKKLLFYIRLTYNRSMNISKVYVGIFRCNFFLNLVDLSLKLNLKPKR